jgi:hypothetical protein
LCIEDSWGEGVHAAKAAADDSKMRTWRFSVMPEHTSAALMMA